jgi:hypothetical protein
MEEMNGYAVLGVVLDMPQECIDIVWSIPATFRSLGNLGITFDYKGGTSASR